MPHLHFAVAILKYTGRLVVGPYRKTRRKCGGPARCISRIYASCRLKIASGRRLIQCVHVWYNVRVMENRQ